MAWGEIQNQSHDHRRHLVSQISKYPGHIQPPSGAVAYAIITSFNGATNFNLASLSKSISAVKPTKSPATRLIGRNKVPLSTDCTVIIPTKSIHVPSVKDSGATLGNQNSTMVLPIWQGLICHTKADWNLKKARWLLNNDCRQMPEQISKVRLNLQQE